MALSEARNAQPPAAPPTLEEVARFCDEFQVGDNADLEYSDPPLVHMPCEEVICTVEPGDDLGTLVRTAADHSCGEGDTSKSGE